MLRRLICGASPHRALDESYRGFFGRAAAQITLAVRNARARQEERSRREALADAARAKAAFLDHVNHELRTPLTLMLGPLEDALASPQRALAGENLELSHRSAHRLLKLVNTLLDLSRIEAGGMQASFEPLDLSVVTSDLAGLFSAALEQAGLRFSVRCEPMPAPVFVDRDMWGTIVLNLLSNAFKFTFEGEIEVMLEVKGDRVELAVRDTGTGIPQHELPRLFERFHRIEGARSRAREGSGIGLSFVQELVHLHGGQIRVESSPGRGSRFTVELPLGSAHLPPGQIRSEPRTTSNGRRADALVREAECWVPDVVPSSPPALAAGSPNQATDVRILVVDDNADMREYIARTLRERWTVVAAASGDAALEMARECQPDLVITDVLMPGLSGFGLLDELRHDARTRGCAVMMLSVRAGGSQLDGLEAGASDYITKPFSPRELIARAATQVQLVRLRKLADGERERLVSFLMQLPVAIAACEGPNHVVTLKNPLVDPLTQGRLRLGHTLSDICRELSLDGLIAMLDRVYSSGDPAVWREQPLWIDRDDGGREERLYDIALQPLRDGHGAVTGIVAAAYEVTAPLSTRLRKEVRRRELVAALVRERAQALVGGTPARAPSGEEPTSRPAPDLPIITGPEVERSELRSDGEASPGPAPVPACACAASIPGAHERTGERRRVLVVDDDRDVVALLKDALVERGFSVAVAYDGPSALQVAQSFHPDTALVDVGLPSMDGFELGRRLRAAAYTPGALRLVAVTGYGRESDRLRSQQAGFDLHLVKPIALDALSGAVLGARSGAARAAPATWG